MAAVCTGCQKTFKAPDEFAGKKVRCKQCGTAFRVPGGAGVAAAAASPAASSAPAPKRQAAVAAATNRHAPKPVEPASPDGDEGEYGLSDDDLGAHMQQAVTAARPYNPSGAVPALGYASPAGAAARPTMATKYPSTGTTVAGRSGGVAPAEGMNWVLWVQLGAFGLPLLLLLMGKIVPALATVGIVAASFMGMAFMLWGQIGILITAGNESSTCLLLYLFIPLYPIYYILTRLEDVMPYLIRTIAGFALMIGAIMMILSQSPR
ncbi:MAG TPA: hypothetical protein VGR35_12530 [Tepidisphaeraceae bacterium]|nr:hypothetical protein [Tepidisphaeraceae bacterium]